MNILGVVSRHAWTLIVRVALMQGIWALGRSVQELGSVDADVYIGAYGAGMSLVMIVIATMAFRKGERWAWMLRWVLPAFFLAHGVPRGGLEPGGLSLGVSVLALLLPVRRFFATPTSDLDVPSAT